MKILLEGLNTFKGSKLTIKIIEPRHEKAGFWLCENEGADQHRSNCEADQRLCFRYTDSTIPLLSKSKSSSF